MTTVRHAPLVELDSAMLYRILALRAQVFVVEQDCVYLDADGRDAEPDAVQLWVEDEDGAVLATARLLWDEGRTARIGRVATAADARGRGLAADIVRCARSLAAGHDVVLNAQSHLEHWYGTLGFVRDGEEFDEDGIPHVPMRNAR